MHALMWDEDPLSTPRQQQSLLLLPLRGHPYLSAQEALQPDVRAKDFVGGGERYLLLCRPDIASSIPKDLLRVGAPWLVFPFVEVVVFE